MADFKISISDVPNTSIKRETNISHFIWLIRDNVIRIKTSTFYLNDDLTPANDAIFPPFEKDFDCANADWVDPATGLYVDNPEDTSGLVKDYDFFTNITLGAILGPNPDPNMKISDLIKLLLGNQIQVIDARTGFDRK